MIYVRGQHHKTRSSLFFLFITFCFCWHVLFFVVRRWLPPRPFIRAPIFYEYPPPPPPHPPSSPSRIMELAFPATMFLSMSADESRQGAWASGARAALASDCNPLSHPSSHSWSRGQAGSGEFGGSFLAGVRSQRQRCDRRVYVRSLVLLCVVLGGVT